MEFCHVSTVTYPVGFSFRAFPMTAPIEHAVDVCVVHSEEIELLEHME